MNDEARYDPPARRFIPEPSVVARVQRAMMEEEDASPPSRRFVRQRWEEGRAATRVAMDALREVWPLELGAMNEQVADMIETALKSVEFAYAQLDSIAELLTTHEMYYVLVGMFRTHEDLDRVGVPR